MEGLEIHSISSTLSNTIGLAIDTSKECKYCESTLDSLFLVSLDCGEGIALLYTT